MVLSWKSIVDFVVLFLIYMLIFHKRWRAKGQPTFLFNTLMYVYVTILLFLTLMPIITSLSSISLDRYVPMFIVPFDDLLKSRGPAEMQIFFNVLMLIPFGFLLPLVKKSSIWSVTFTTFIVSTTIEIIQPLLNTYRISDVTDIITNTLGGFIGYLLYVMCKPYIESFMEKRGWKFNEGN